MVVALLPYGELEYSFKAVADSVVTLDLKRHPLKSIYQLFRLLKEHKHDVIQTWMYHADFLGGVIGRMAGAKKIFWGVRNTHAPDGSKVTRLLISILAKLSGYIPSRIISVAESAVESHIKYGYKGHKFNVIPNGYPFEQLARSIESRNKIRSGLGVDRSTILIGCVGRFHKDKGQDLFVQIAKQVNSKNVKYLMLGKNCTNLNSQLVRDIDASGLNDKFMLLGQSDDVPSYLNAMDLFCMPSRTEGFPNALAEALGSGLFSIAFDVGDSSKLSCPSLVLVPPMDVRQFAQEINSFLDKDKGEINCKVSASKSKLQEKFGIKTSYALYKEVYESV